jgi:hypothetical protein
VGVPPHVHGLLLTPQELSIGVPPQLPRYQVKGEGHQLQTHTRLFVGMCVVVYTLCTRSVPGQRGRAPAADTHTLVSWNVCRCAHALYQVKGEGHQLQTHTCTCLGMYVVVYHSVPGQRGRAPAEDTHMLILECMLLCTRSVPSQRGRAPTADTHICALSWNVSRVYMLSTRSKGKGTNCRHTHTHTHTHTCTCLEMYIVVYMLCTKSRGSGINCTQTQTHTHVLDICLCADLVSGQIGRAPNAQRYGWRESDTDTHAQTILLCMY